MRLYHSATSPYVRKVMMVLKHTGLEDGVELIPGSGTPMEPNAGTVSANPIGKVPCLVTDDGEPIHDSRIICRYLDARAGAGLYPEGDALWGVSRRESIAEGILDAALLAVYETRLRPENMRFAPWVEAQTAKVTRGVAALESEAEALAGPLRADQIAAGAALGYLDFRFPGLGWRDGAPKLTAWFEDFARTPIMTETVPKA